MSNALAKAKTLTARREVVGVLGKLTKREVIAALGKSKRTVETYIASGRLPVHYVSGPNGKQAIFDRAAVERFKRDLEAPTPRLLPAPQQTAALTTRQTDPQNLLAALLAAVQPGNTPRMKPWLTLDEATEFSGLPRAYLLTQAREGTIRALNVGSEKQQRWRLHRASLAK